MVINHLNAQQKDCLRTLIRQIEARSDGEIVTVIAPCSDNYLSVCVAWILPLVLILPLFLSLWWGSWSVSDIFNIQVLSGCLLWLLFQWWPLRRLLISKKRMYRRAKRMAHELFFMQKLHYKKQRNAIMLFVSVAERYVEILADKGIVEKVEPQVWQDIVQAFLNQVQQGNIVEGYQDAIERCGALLIKHFPLSTQSRDELPNHLIEWNWY